METCQKCGVHFPASEAWTTPPSLNLMTGWGFLNIKVRCPTCHNIFPATEHRFLGVLTPSNFKRIFLTLYILFIVYGVYLIFFN